jgi:DNA helicase-2/ATP-dependent DNA helicase PcrA
MNEDFLNILNTEQKKAVLHTDGPMIILAGAGSGKTRCITAKVLYLIEKGSDPSHILCVTFTNKAATEMKERIQLLLSAKHSTIPTIATFHALCAKILRIEGKYIGLSSQFVIYDTADQLETIKSAMEKWGISSKEWKPAAILGTISGAKNELISDTAYESFARGHFQQIVAKIYPTYQKILKENDAVDFDDLLLKTVQLFQENPHILEKYQNKFRYILVDEYQDTNHAQYKLTKMLADKWKNICVVGDFSQSIYSWRGADFQNCSFV